MPLRCVIGAVNGKLILKTGDACAAYGRYRHPGFGSMPGKDDEAPQLVLLLGDIAPYWLKLGAHGEYVGREAVAWEKGGGAMVDQSEKQISEALGKIGRTLEQILDAQRELAKSTHEWQAADIALRKELIKNQLTAVENNQNVQRAQRRFLLGMGFLAAIMLMVGLALVSEPWWMPARAYFSANTSFLNHSPSICFS